MPKAASAPRPKNPFAPAERVQKKLKVLVYGESGAGKTWFGLTFPGPVAMIDCEGGSELYGGRNDVQSFDVLRTKSYDEVMQAMDFIEQDGGKSYQTVVVDPITVIWQILQEAASLKNERKVKEGKLNDPALTYRDWGIIKSRLNRLYVRLTNLPCHVVVTSRLKDVMAKQGNDMVKVGVKPDSEKQTEYLFDIVLRLVRSGNGEGKAKYHAVTEKDRSGSLPYLIDDASFASLAHIAEGHAVGQTVQAVADEDAAQGESQAMEQEEVGPTPTTAKPQYKRPMSAVNLRAFISKRIAGMMQSGDASDALCSEEDAKALATDWREMLGHNRNKRLAVAAYLISDEITSFNELSEAECAVLGSWLHSDVPNAHAEGESVWSLFPESEVEAPQVAGGEDAASG